MDITIPYHYIYNSSYELDTPTFSEAVCGYALGIDKDAKFIEEWKIKKKTFNK